MGFQRAAGLALLAAAGYGLYSVYNMSDEEFQEFVDDVQRKIKYACHATKGESPPAWSPQPKIKYAKYACAPPGQGAARIRTRSFEVVKRSRRYSIGILLA